MKSKKAKSIKLSKYPTWFNRYFAPRQPVKPIKPSVELNTYDRIESEPEIVLQDEDIIELSGFYKCEKEYEGGDDGYCNRVVIYKCAKNTRENPRYKTQTKQYEKIWLVIPPIWKFIKLG